MSLELKKRGTTWTYVVDVGRDPKTGKRKRKSKGGFKTKGECRVAASELISTVEKGSFYEIDKISLEDYMIKYLDTISKQISHKTYKTYLYINESHITPNLGKLELSKIKPLHIQDFYNKSLEKLSSTTVRHFHNLLNKAFDQAIKWQLLYNNPCEFVDKPKRNKTQLNVLDEIQLKKFLERIERMTIYLPVLLASSTGMRLGEICGLTWKDIDLDNSIIYVQNQLQKIDTTLKLVKVKTESSKRNISIPESVVTILKNIKITQEDNKKYFNNSYDKNFFVLCKNDGSPYDPGYISRNFNRVLKEYSIAKELNIPVIRFHDLRHTHATILLKANVNPKIVAERLGHSSVNMTLNTYSHVLPSIQKEAADKLNNIFL